MPAPAPPASIGPNAPPPPQGSWPALGIRAVAGLVNEPLTIECRFRNDPLCPLLDPLTYGEIGSGGELDTYDENWKEALVPCPLSTSSTLPPVPSPSPVAHPDPVLNKLNCHHKGMMADGVELEYSAGEFCDDLESWAEYWGRRPPPETFTRELEVWVGGGAKFPIKYFFTLFAKCNWPFQKAECKRYAMAVVDASRGWWNNLTPTVWMQDRRASNNHVTGLETRA